jgi:hypothetical protein
MKKSPKLLFVALTLSTLCLALLPAFFTPTSPALAKDKKKEKGSEYALIKGSVFRDDGFSIQGARITCRKAADKKPKWETFSGEGGEFAFRVPAGKMEYIVTAEAPGREPASKNVEIEKDERQDISIVLNSKKP